MSITIDFLDELLSAESEYYPDGIKKPKFRTREESIRYCNRVTGYRFDPLSVTTKQAREYPCGIVDSAGGTLPVCEKCVARRKRMRVREFMDRIERALLDGDTLFVAKAETRRDMANVQQNAKRNGYLYISFPTGAGDERVVILNGSVKGSEITPDREIRSLIMSLSGLVSDGRVSGKLGFSDEVSPLADFPVPDVLYLFDKTIITNDIYGQIEARAIFASSSMPAETREDVSALIDRRQKSIIAMLKNHDKNARMIVRGEKRVQFDELKRNIYIRKMRESGATRMVDPETKNAMDIIQGELVNFDGSLLEEEDGLSSLGIIW